jgi:hypothetical protein
MKDWERHASTCMHFCLLISCNDLSQYLAHLLFFFLLIPGEICSIVTHPLRLSDFPRFSVVVISHSSQSLREVRDPLFVSQNEAFSNI